jgi:fucose 4-O-acetylase-like acetyltransferase
MVHVDVWQLFLLEVNLKIYGKNALELYLTHRVCKFLMRLLDTYLMTWIYNARGHYVSRLKVDYQEL